MVEEVRYTKPHSLPSFDRPRAGRPHPTDPAAYILHLFRHIPLTSSSTILCTLFYLFFCTPFYHNVRWSLNCTYTNVETYSEAWRYTGQFSRWNRFKNAFPGLGIATVAFAGYCLYEHFFLKDDHHHHGSEEHH